MRRIFAKYPSYSAIGLYVIKAKHIRFGFLQSRGLRLTIFARAAAAFFFFCSLAWGGELGADKFELALLYLPPSVTVPEGQDAYRFVSRALAKKAIADARDAGIGFLRVGITGWWPNNFGVRSDLSVWQSDPTKFWARLDEMFDDLDKAKVRLVPTFLWQASQFAALGGDTVGEFVKNPRSHGRLLFDRFVREFIGRYKSRSTILFYELTNEMNLQADLNLASKCPKQNAGRCVWDHFTTAEMVQFSRDATRLIKSLDPSRLVSSGYAIPRPAAWHLMQQAQFSAKRFSADADTFEEFTKYLLAVHQPFDIISVHIYPIRGNNRFGRPANREYDLVADSAMAAKIANKPLFVGEFGGPTPFVLKMLDQLARYRVSFAAFWLWEGYRTATERAHNFPRDPNSVEPGYSDSLIKSIEETENAIGSKPVAPPRTPNEFPRIVLIWPLPCAIIKVPVNLAAVASDGDTKVKQVEFLVNGKLVRTDVDPPYEASFDPRGFQGSTVDIVARAISTKGTSAVFKSTVRVRDGAACSVPRD